MELVILTYTHIDHSGYLPKMVHDGFRGCILCTETTADLLSIMLLDSAKLQEEEAAYANKKGYSKHHSAEPLYTRADVEHMLPLVETIAYDVPIALPDGLLTLIFWDAHIEDPEADLVRVVTEVLDRGGVLLIAAFAVGRT